jgi:beta-galactosidase
MHEKSWKQKPRTALASQKSRLQRLSVFAALLLVGLPLVPGRNAAAQQPVHHIGIDGENFVLDGKPLQIISGEMHYARIPRAYWRDRMKKARAMGLNTISTYVFWNLHESSPGQYDFTREKNVAEFIRTAQEEGLYVILRPGPYVCAEWDLGGFPAWLLAEQGMVLRSTDEKFMRAAQRWLIRLGKELAPLQISRGGPIIAVQVENEYGSFDSDHEYMRRIRDAIVEAGLGEVLLYTADGADELAAGTLPGVPAVVNFGPGGAKEELTKLEKFRPGQPLMSGEYWAGWFDHWSEKHQITDAGEQAREIGWMLQQGYSLNLYMFHGGTSFGFMSGANSGKNYTPTITSYDYDAALDEAGRPTKKFFAFRDTITGHQRKEKLPDLPVAVPTIEIPAFSLAETAPLMANLPKPIASDQPQSMEAFNQAYGYILYRTRLHGPVSGELIIRDLHDYAEIFLDGKRIGTLDRRLGQDRINLSVEERDAQMDIFVENSGRINFTKALREDRKGITRSVTLVGNELNQWQIFPLPTNDFASLHFSHAKAQGPAFYRAYFRLKRLADTFLDTRGWGKGAVWVNGHPLGKFWNIGPQQTLYLPSPWLRKGINEVVLFALDDPETSMLRGLREPVLDQVQQSSAQEQQ